MEMQTVEELIAASRPRSRMMRGSMLLLLGLAMFLGAMLADPARFAVRGPYGWLIPQVVLLTMIALVLRHAVRQRRTSQLMLQAFESVQLRQWERARQALARLLRRPLSSAPARAESLLALACVAEAEQDYAAAQRIYESLLQERIADPLQLHNARLGLATALLRTGQTTDAISMIDRLSRCSLPGPLRAQVELLSLFRELVMGQPDLEHVADRRELFREHLGTNAGYGYALLSAACDRSGDTEQARLYWHDATMLVRRNELLQRFPELAAVAARYPAAEHVL